MSGDEVVKPEEVEGGEPVDLGDGWKLHAGEGAVPEGGAKPRWHAWMMLSRSLEVLARLAAAIAEGGIEMKIYGPAPAVPCLHRSGVWWIDAPAPEVAAGWAGWSSCRALARLPGG